jgi:hypothetical protein
MADQVKRCAYPEVVAILLLISGLRTAVEASDRTACEAVDHTVTVTLLGEDDSLLGEATFYVCGLCELLLSRFFPVEYVKSVKLRLPRPVPAEQLPAEPDHSPGAADVTCSIPGHCGEPGRHPFAAADQAFQDERTERDLARYRASREDAESARWPNRMVHTEGPIGAHAEAIAEDRRRFPETHAPVRDQT